jgi:hypothetical protein
MSEATNKTAEARKGRQNPVTKWNGGEEPNGEAEGDGDGCCT